MKALTNEHVETCRPKLVRYIRKNELVDERDIEDIVQEAFIKAMRNIKKIKEGSLLSWLITQAFFLSCNLIRAEVRRIIREETYTEIWRGYVMAGRDMFRDPTNTILIEEIFTDSIPLLCRQIVWMHSYEGISMADVAQKKGISYGSAWKKYRKGLKELRENCNENSDRILNRMEVLLYV